MPWVFCWNSKVGLSQVESWIEVLVSLIWLFKWVPGTCNIQMWYDVVNICQKLWWKKWIQKSTGFAQEISLHVKEIAIQFLERSGSVVNGGGNGERSHSWVMSLGDGEWMDDHGELRRSTLSLTTTWQQLINDGCCCNDMEENYDGTPHHSSRSYIYLHWRAFMFLQSDISRYMSQHLRAHVHSTTRTPTVPFKIFETARVPQTYVSYILV